MSTVFTKVLRKAWLIAVLATFSSPILAQQDPQLSMFMFPKLFFNPASAGMNNGICAYVAQRQQWTGFEGRPETYLFGAHGTFTIPKINLRSGGGLSIMGDGAGQSHFFGLKAAYSAHIPIKFIGGEPGHLGIGASVGMLQFSIGNNWRSLNPFWEDPNIPDQGFTTSGLDVDAGLFYQSPRVFIGVSVMHANGLTFTSEGQSSNSNTGVPWKSSFTMARHYYLTAGYDWPIPSNPLFVLKPALLLKSDLVSAQADVAVQCEWNNFIWAGATYRYTDAAALMAGVNWAPPIGMIKAGYSYDITTSSLRTGSNGSHELFVQYCLALKQKSPVSRHKSVRFL